VSLRRVIFLNRFFHPDHSAKSQVVSDLAFHLAASGTDVHAITSGQLYDLPRAALAKEELVNGVHVHRLATTRFGHSGLLGRVLDYASYYGLMWYSARSLVDHGDILVAKTDPPLTSIVAMQVALQRKARLVNWLQDIYPESAAELGVPLMRGVVGRVLCIGGSHQFNRLARSVSERGLNPMFRFIAYQPQEILKYSLNVPDVHSVSLRPQLEGLIVPSKFYGIAAVGRPIISITASDGEIAVRQHECGLVAEPGDGPALARALIDLAADPPRVTQMGTRARAMLDRNFARARALARWRELLEGIGEAA
jgi:hypothetical protein